MADEGLKYKGRPLRRIDKIIYYGSMAEKYIIMMQITETQKMKDTDIATGVMVQLQLTAPDIKAKDRIVKKTETTGIYEALDIGAIWLERALARDA